MVVRGLKKWNGKGIPRRFARRTEPGARSQNITAMEFKIIHHRYSEPRELEFSTIKSLTQWERRNASEYQRHGCAYVRYIRRDGRKYFEQFTTVSNVVLTLSELEKMVAGLNDDARRLQLARRCPGASKGGDNPADLT
jgi:hypothetical protein